ncbi:hypothetical protein [Iningainema tapete]|uniref:Uncharacterized protein n=2 Tax=Iningainema TaxID=1932705 RepID=A0A8J6XRH5_9CYAN|nr:hypothetical protein [Iningainema tapete BLCC-T55]
MARYPATTEIRLIGARSSGKTTYLATLAHLPHQKQLESQFPGLAVTYDKNSEAGKLARMAEDIIKKGTKLAGTNRGNVNNLPYYYFRIQIPSRKGLPGTEIELTVRDFAGEIFHDIPLEHKWHEIQSYIDDLFTAQSWMVMLTDWQPSQDTRLYKPALEKLCQEISEREQVNREIKNLRIAVVMSKCERGEIWPCRLEPEEDLFKVRLPQTYRFLTKKFPPRTNRLKFFACSSFGVLSSRPNDFDPRPNRYIPDDGSPADYNAFLRSPSQWHPFGLISPIYWLSTGKTLHDQHL